MQGPVRTVLVWLSALGPAFAQAPPPAEPPAPGLYSVVIETGMPNLDVNLRYATVRDQRCLDRRDLARVFPMLGDTSLQDCHLAKASEQPDGAVYALQCSGGHGTEGEAHWSFEPRALAGTLNVKLGGKNMTFYQRLTGRLLGACTGAPGTAAR